MTKAKGLRLLIGVFMNFFGLVFEIYGFLEIISFISHGKLEDNPFFSALEYSFYY